MRKKTVILVALLAAFLCIASLSSVASSAQVQEYYVLGDENGALLSAYTEITTHMPTGTWGAWSSGAMNGTVSIVAWEPVNVTRDTNYDGVAENFELLDTGEIWTIDNATDGPLGGDLIRANGSISVVRTAWRDYPGTFAAGTWELFSTNVWGTEYVVPIGNTTNGTSQLIVQAKEDNTNVTVTGFAPVILNRGEDHHFKNVTVGTRVSANKSVQAGIITCQDGYWTAAEQGIDPIALKRWETRYFTLTPRSLLGTEYYVPVPSFNDMYSKLSASAANDTAPPSRTVSPVITRLHIYAFNNTNVTIENATSVQYVTIPAGEVNSSYVMPAISGVYKNVTDPAPNGSYAVCLSGNDTIWVVATCDDNYPDFDWGFQCINRSLLSDDYYIPWSPANPVYVTPVGDTTVFNVDYDLDGTTDETFTLSRFDMRMVYPNSTLHDLNMTGVHINASGKFAIQWGQDNNEDTPGERAEPPTLGNPDNDFGYTILPIRELQQHPGTWDGYVYEDPNCNCTYDPSEIGVPNVNVSLYNTSGLVNTTTTDGIGYYLFTNLIQGDYWASYNVSNLPPYLTPKCDDDTPEGGSATDINTSGKYEVPEDGTHRHNFAVESEAGIRIVKLVDSVKIKEVLHNQTVTYTLNITNTGKVNLTNITVVDTLPAGITWADVANITEDDVTTYPNGTTRIVWKNHLTGFEPLEPEEFFVIWFNATINESAVSGETYRNWAEVNATSDWGNVTDKDYADVLVNPPERVPVLTPFGIAALIGLLSLVVVYSISKGVRRKKG